MVGRPHTYCVDYFVVKTLHWYRCYDWSKVLLLQSGIYN